MALNLQSLLPSLYNVQKVFEDYVLQYGNQVYLNPDLDGRAKVKPSKAKNIATLNLVADNLINYYNVKVGLENTQKSQEETSNTYFGLLTTILGIVALIAFIVLIMLIFEVLMKDTNETLGKLSEQIQEMVQECIEAASKEIPCSHSQWIILFNKLWRWFRESSKTVYENICGDNWIKNEISGDTFIDLLPRLCIATIIYIAIAYTIYYTNEAWKRQKNYQIRAFNLDNFVEKNTILKLVNMFRVKETNGSVITLSIASSPVAYYYASQNQTQQIIYDDNCPCYSAGKIKAADKSPSSVDTTISTTSNNAYKTTSEECNKGLSLTSSTSANNPLQKSKENKEANNQSRSAEKSNYLTDYLAITTKNKTPQADTKYFEDCKDMAGDGVHMYPFDAHNDGASPAINPFELKQEIEALNMFEQEQRLAGAINYMKSFLLRSSDTVYSTVTTSISPSARTALHVKIADYLTKGMAIVPDLTVSKSVTSQTSPGEAQCFSAAMNNPIYIAATYYPQTSTCYLCESSDTLLYTGSSSSSRTILKNTQGQVKITSDLQKGSVLSSTYSNYISSSGDYASILAPASSSSLGKSASNFHVTTMSSNIVKTHVDVPVILTAMPEWITANIAQMIITSDPTNTFTMDMSDMSAIQNIIQTNIGSSYAAAQGPLTDILTQVPFVLSQKLEDGIPDISGGEKYIPYDRFMSKISALDSRSFVTSFVYNTNEIYATANGINNMYLQFGTNTDDLLVNSNMREQGMMWLGMTLFLIWIIVFCYLLKDLLGKKEDVPKADENNMDEKTKLADFIPPQIGEPKAGGGDCKPFINALVEVGDAILKAGDQKGGGEIDLSRRIQSKFNKARRAIKDIDYPIENNDDETIKIEKNNNILVYTTFLNLKLEALNKCIKLFSRGKYVEFKTEYNKFVKQSTVTNLDEKLKENFEKAIEAIQAIETEAVDILKEAYKGLGGVKLAEEDAKTTTLAHWSTFCANMTIITAVMLVFFFLVLNTHIKKTARDKYNLQTMQNNAQSMVQNATNCINIFYTDVITNDYYGIKKPLPATNPYIGNNIIFDKYTFNSSQEPATHMAFNTIAGGSTIDSTIKIKINSAASLDTVYTSLIDILESYNTCNAIFALKSEKAPFPIVEISLYVIVLVVSLVVLALVWINLKPMCLARTFLEGTYIDTTNDKYGTAYFLGDCETLDDETTTKENIFMSKEMETGFKFLGSAIIIVIVALFIWQLQTNASLFPSSLFSTTSVPTCSVL